MMTKLLVITILFYCGIQLQTVDGQITNPVVIKGGSSSSCAPLEARQATIEMLRNNIKNRLLPVTMTECGDGMWYSIASTDMTDPQQQCPTAWREYNEGSVRACGRPVTNSSSCANTPYSIGHQYSKVCGRAIGYQVGPVHGIFTNRTINQNYVDGVSITYGRNPRQHIWTYIAGLTENGTASRRRNCPCSDSLGRQPPDFVNNSYHCESANPSDVTDSPGSLYSRDKLWDGQQCSNEGNCCISESLPWFSVTLPNPVSDDIEVRICSHDSTATADTLVEQLDIFVQ